MQLEKRLLLILLLNSGWASNASAGDAIDTSLAVPATAVISINNTRGAVAIIGWDQAQVSIKGELDDLAEALVFGADEGLIVVDVKMPRQDLNWGNGSDLTIQVPHSSRVKFVGVSSEVKIESVRGGVQLQSISGDLRARKIEGQLIMNNVSGDIIIEDVAGSVLASTISGDLALSVTATEVRLDTVSGDLVIEMAAIDHLAARSVSGRMEVVGELNPAGQIDLSSVSGDIRLGLQSGLNATVDLDGGMSGAIENRLSKLEAQTHFPARQRLNAVFGDGKGRVSVRTVSADIKLEEG